MSDEPKLWLHSPFRADGDIKVQTTGAQVLRGQRERLTRHRECYKDGEGHARERHDDKGQMED